MKRILTALLLAACVSVTYGQEHRVDAGDPELIMAEMAAAMEPVSVMQKPKSFTGDLHNYESLSSYAWPDPSDSAAPWTDRDGELNPEVNRYDRTRINDMSSRLSLFFRAWQKSGEKRFKDAYFKQLDTWFLDKSTRMNPNMEYSQIRVGADDNHGQPHGIIDAYVLTDVLRTLRDLDRRGELGESRKEALVAWFSEFNDWLMTSHLAERERAQDNNHSVACDVLIYDIALFTGNNAYADAIQNSFAPSRLAVQIRPDGTMPGELKRTRAYHYSIFNLKHILDFCFLARDVRGVDFYSRNRESIDAAAAYLFKFLGHKELFPYMQIEGLSTWEDEENLLAGELSRLALLRDGAAGTALKRELYMVDHNDTYSDSFREERKQEIRSRYSTRPIKTTPSVIRQEPEPRNPRPYSDIDWSTAIQINTTSHGHCEDDETLAEYQKRNFGFYTISNYYPSAPTYPAGEMTVNRGYPVWNHPVVVNGTLTDGPFDWNEIIRPWADSLKMEPKTHYPSGYPLKPSKKKMFSKWQRGMLEAPNAEHHGFLFEDGRPVPHLHMCSPGSMYASGTFDARDRYKTNTHGYSFGCSLFWKTAVDKMIEGLIYPDGGGVTINHPSWTRMDRAFLLEMLDYDPRILGIEVIEHGRNSEHYWDWVLASGRQCYGLFVPDWAAALHETIFGVNVLLVKERTVHECLKAYRKGDFYGALLGLGALKFTYIGYENGTFTARTDKEAKFEVITARGIVHTCTGTECSYVTEKDKKGWGTPSADVYVRVRATATDGSGEVLFTQAVML